MPTFRQAATRDLFVVLLRGWKLLLGLPIVFGVIALLLCSLQTPLYEATVTLYVTSNGNSQSPSSPYENVMGSALSVGSYSKLAYTDAVLKPAIAAAGLNMTADEAKKIVRAQVTPDTVMMTVSAKDQDGSVALRFASAVANSLVDKINTMEVPNGGGPPTSSLTIVTPATLNPSPVSPPTLMVVALATILGLGVGVAVRLTRERLNNTVRDERDIEKVVGTLPVGRIPHDKTLAAALTADFDGPAAGTAAARAFQHLRTAFLVAHSERSLATLLVTSPRDDEGKSSVALNLAAALAESGSAVVLVDADLGNPVGARRTANAELPGLADYLQRQVAPPPLSAMAIDSLKFIGAGRMRGNDPAGLLASGACEKFFKDLAESFDYVIVDSSPLLDGPEAEAAARWADGVLLVARRGKSKLTDFNASVARLSEIGAELMGVVLNDVHAPKGRQRQAAPPAARRHRLEPATPTVVDEVNVGAPRNSPAKAPGRKH